MDSFLEKDIESFFNSVTRDEVKVVRYLLKLKPGLIHTLYGFKKQTPVHYCKSVQMLELLLEKGGSPNGTDSQWDTPMTVFSTKGLDGNIDMIMTLVDRGADVNQRDILHRNALFYCSSHITETLVEIGTRINDKDVDGNTPLQYMCESMASIVKIHKLIELGADPRIVSNGKTAKDILLGNRWHFHGGAQFFKETIELFDYTSRMLYEKENREKTWNRRREFALLVFSYGDRDGPDKRGKEVDSTKEFNAMKLILEDGVSGSGYKLFDQGKEWGRMIMEYV